MNQVIDMIRAAHEIKNLNLTRIVKKVQLEKSWTDEQAQQAERRYRNFLLMITSVANESVVPTSEIDAIWHGHILDTRAYGNDCQRIFGRFIHHIPQFGEKKDPNDESILRTAACYKQLFNEEYFSKDNSLADCCQGGTQPHCRHACYKLCCTV